METTCDINAGQPECGGQPGREGQPECSGQPGRPSRPERPESGVLIELNVPFYSGAVPGLASVVPEADRSAYVAALAREVRSAAGDAAGEKVAQISFVGGTPANMGLAAWCGLMDDLRASFPGADLARLRFDVVPDLVSPKTAQYAFRYRALFNLVLESVDQPTLDASARARDALLAEKLDNFGFQLALRSLGGGAPAIERLRSLIDLRPAYVRMVDVATETDAGAPVDTLGVQTRALLAEAGFKELAAGLFCRLGRAPQWFRATYAGGVLGFGLGSRTHLGGSAFWTTEDAALYLDQAGRSGSIYRAL